MKVEIIDVPEEMKDEEFHRNLAHLQVEADRLGDIRERFGLCLHEGAHILHTRRLGWKVKDLRGPHVELEDGKLRYRRGCVVPDSRGCGLPHCDVFFYDWGIAKVYVAGFMTVEAITGQPNGQHVIDTDLRLLREELDTTPGRLEQAVKMGKLLVREDFCKPWFLDELGSCVREYEMTVFGTDQTWDWAWKEYHPELPGTRHRVAVTTTGYYGTLVVDGDDLTLLTEGEAYKPTDTIRGNPLVLLSNRKDKRAENVVRRWNEQVHANANGGK